MMGICIYKLTDILTSTLLNQKYSSNMIISMKPFDETTHGLEPLRSHVNIHTNRVTATLWLIWIQTLMMLPSSQLFIDISVLIYILFNYVRLLYFIYLDLKK